MSGIKKQSTSYSAKATVDGETNDCHVRAISLAAGISYEESHRLHEEAGRVRGEGTHYTTSRKVISALGLKVVKYENCKYPPALKGRSYVYPTVKQFIWDHPKGTYLVHRRGHAFAIIDGVVHDWAHGTGPRSRVVFAAKFGD